MRLRLKFGSASLSPVTFRNVRLGGPQFAGSWLLPVMPASADTFVRFAKYGVDVLVNSWYCTRGRMVRNWLMRRVHWSDVSTPDTELSSSHPNIVVWCVRMF